MAYRYTGETYEALQTAARLLVRESEKGLVEASRVKCSGCRGMFREEANRLDDKAKLIFNVMREEV